MAPATRSSAAKSRALYVVPIVICICILFQTYALYGSCRAPAQVQDLQGLQAYLLQTSQTVRRRSPEAADALQQLATEVVRGSEQLQQLQQDMKDARGFLDSGKEKTLQMMVEITSLKASSNRQNERLQELENNLKNAQEAARNSQQQLEEGQKQLQEKEQHVKKLQDQLQVQQTAASAPASTPAAAAADIVAGRLHALELAGLQCNAVTDQEFWADALVFGYEHRAQDASECCAACHAYNAAADRGGTEKGLNATRCNMWAFCADKEACKDRFGECWVKHQNLPLPPPPQLPPDPHAVKGWVSGAIYLDAVIHPHHANTTRTLVLHTSLGDIEVKLLPALAPASVRELQRAAWLHSKGASKCSNCRIYRPEPGFLVQGILEAPGSYVAVPRYPNPAQPMTMPRGMICWAGGTGGPHWFVNLIDQSGFKDEHLCWGQTQDMALFDKIVMLPKRDKKPGDMNELVEHISYNISLKTS